MPPMNPWEMLKASDSLRVAVPTTLIFILLGSLILRMAPAQRRAVLRCAAFYAFMILVLFVGALLEVAEFERLSIYTNRVALLLAGISVIQLVGIFVFRIVIV